jgi:amino acid transporter
MISLRISISFRAAQSTPAPTGAFRSMSSVGTTRGGFGGGVYARRPFGDFVGFQTAWAYWIAAALTGAERS